MTVKLLKFLRRQKGDFIMMDFMDHKLTDLVDTQMLRDLQESYSDSTEMVCYITDDSGRPLVSGSKPTDFFKKVWRATASGGYGSVLSYKAGIHMIDAPISLNGKHIGHLLSGQVLSEDPSDAMASGFASELGMTKSEYMTMASSLKIIPEITIKAHGKLAESIANLISSKAQSEHIKLISSSDGTGSGVSANMIAKLSEAEGLVLTNSTAMEKLRDEFTQLESIAGKSVTEVKSTKETIKVIQDVAMNTRILGFNAYIEAARAKEYGKSFGVITQEIRDLADKSKESADKIEDAMVSINSSTTQIDLLATAFRTFKSSR